MSSVQPLVITYSFAANRTQAVDSVDLDQLDAILGQVADKLTEVIDAMNVVQREDDTLSDQIVDFRSLNDDVVEELSSLVNAAVTASV